MKADLLRKDQVDRGFTAIAARFDFVAELVVLVEAVDARVLNGGDVDKVVLAAAFRRDEAKALGGVEELDGAIHSGHGNFLLARSKCKRAAPQSDMLRGLNVRKTDQRAKGWDVPASSEPT